VERAETKSGNDASGYYPRSKLPFRGILIDKEHNH